MRRRTLAVVLLSFTLLNLAPCLGVESEESIDEALLEDLGAELLKPATSEPTDTLDQKLLEQFGEDANKSQPAQGDWLSKVVTPMKTAQSLLEQMTLLEQTDAADNASTAQKDALSGIDAMIVELTERQNRCKGGDCKKPGTPKAGKKPGKKGSSSGKAGKNPAKGSSPSTNSGADLSTDMAIAGELVKDLWGNLPERQREQILQPLSEEFLPKYASEIEAYFRALADPDRTREQAR